MSRRNELASSGEKNATRDGPRVGISKTPCCIHLLTDSETVTGRMHPAGCTANSVSQVISTTSWPSDGAKVEGSSSALRFQRFPLWATGFGVPGHLTLIGHHGSPFMLRPRTWPYPRRVEGRRPRQVEGRDRDRSEAETVTGRRPRPRQIEGRGREGRTPRP